MGSDCCSQRNPQESSLSQIGGTNIRNSRHYDPKKINDHHELESVYVDKSESEKKQVSENSHYHMNLPPLFNKVESFYEITHEEEQQKVIEFTTNNQEQQNKNLNSSIHLRIETQTQTTKNEIPQIIEKQQSQETFTKVQSNLEKSPLKNDFNDQQNSLIDFKDQQQDNCAYTNDSQQQNSHIENEYPAYPKPKVWTFEEKYKYVPDIPEESHQISFSNNFNTVNSYESNIEQRIKTKTTPGKLSLLFLKALEKKILGKTNEVAASANQQEPEISVADRPVRKCRPRQPQQLQI